MERKTIAVCLTGYDAENEIQMLLGAYRRCRALGMNMLVFFNTIRKPELNSIESIPGSVILGEAQTFGLINYDIIDGILLFGESFLNDGLFSEIIKKAGEHGIPAVTVDDYAHSDGCCQRVLMDNEPAMEKLIDHLIEVHGASAIDFISGFKNNPQSEQRLSAYRSSLEKHGIAFDPSRVYYGEFWKKAIECTDEIISRGIPDAIACANDTMALFCMDRLKERGFSVPGDVIVTGFDAINDSREYVPSPTTVRRALTETGSAAIDALADRIYGRSSVAAGDILVESVLVKGQSCGCMPLGESFAQSYDSKYELVNEYREFNRYILNMNTAFSGAESSARLFDSLTHGAELLGINEMYICIGADIEHCKTDYTEGVENKRGGLSDKMVSMYQRGHDIPVGEVFDTKRLLPRGIDDSDEPVLYVFTSLYFKDRALGYMALVPSTLAHDGDLFGNWLINICNNTGSFYMNREYEEALNELQGLYLHDSLTGLYNRRGMNRYESDYIRRCIANGWYVAAVCADVDGLKKINDTYGHEEGDVAILIAATAIKEVFPPHSICVRTGGDEFFVIAAVLSERVLRELIGNVYARISDFNKHSQKPYTVGCSCGFAQIADDSQESYELAKKHADRQMYEEKKRRKAVRED